MKQDEFLQFLDRKYTAIFGKAAQALYALGGDEVADYVDAAIVYYFRQVSLRTKWESEDHAVHAIAQKSRSLRLDEIKKQKRQESIRPTSDEEGSEVNPGEEIDYLILARGMIEEQSKYDLDKPDEVCTRNDTLRRALAAMTPLQRIANVLEACGYSKHEIAEHMGISYDAVRQVLKRGREAGRRAIEG